MLYRVAAPGRALRQVTRVAQNCSKTSFTALAKCGAETTPARHTATRRDGSYHSQAIRTISSERDQCPKIETYRDVSSKADVDIDHIESRMKCTKFKNSTWGFVIYKCFQGNQAAWNRLLEALRTELRRSLRFYIREDMLEFHDLHTIDDETLYGATSHQVRDHFRSWVPKSLEDRLRPDATNLDDDVGWILAKCTPRYEFCLFVDDLCLESMDYPSMTLPVVKLLDKAWESPFPPEERNYTIPYPFHDGATDDWEEDVGWMYMPLTEYLYKYDILAKCWWDDQYVRPPYIHGFENESTFVGNWRQDASGERA